MLFRLLRCHGVWAGAAIVGAASLAACLLPSYKDGSTGTSTGSGVVCPPMAYVRRFGSDTDRVETQAFARAADGTSAIAGQFYQSLVWTNGQTISVAPSMPQNPDGFVVGMDVTGTSTWVVQLGGPGFESIVQLAATKGGFVVLGRASAGFTIGNLTTSAFMKNEGFVAMITSTGAVAWLDVFTIDDVMNHFAAPQAMAVDPVTGEIVVVGQLQGTLGLDGYPNPVTVTPPTSPMQGQSPFYVHLDATGQVKGNAAAFQIWPTQQQTVVNRVLLAPDGSHFLLGGYQGTFANAALQNPPPSSPSFDGFVMRVDKSDIPQEVYAYGSPTRDDRIIDGVLANGSMYLLFDSVGSMNPTTKFDLGGVSPDISVLQATFAGVLAQVTLPGSTGVFAKAFAADKDLDGSLALRKGDPLLSLRFHMGTATYDGHMFSTDDLDTVFLHVRGTDGALIEDFDLGAMGHHLAFAPTDACGDTVAGAFSGAVTLNGQAFKPAADNGLLWFAPSLPFVPPP